jgi:GntR family transcriptional regulator / MocR family aminotransferase
MRHLRAGFLPSIGLDPDASMPLRRQLYEWFRRAITDGRLKSGQRVPSSRSLAKELKVSRLTVVSAYEQLEAEGYLQTFRGAGTCIAASIPELRRRGGARTGRAERRARGTRRTAMRAKRLLQVPDEPRPPIAGPFRVSLPALDHFPRRTWSRLISRHARGASIRDMAYGDPMGEPQFRAAIAEYLGAVRAVRCDASQIMVTSGSQQAVQITLSALLDPGDPVWVEEPGYSGMHRALLGSGCELVPVPVDGEGLKVEEGIRRQPAARAAYVTPSHQYPLGMTLSAGRRVQLLNWAQSADAWIIEDDYDSEYRFGTEPITSLQGLDTDDRVIYIGTFSKVLFPALRMGYLVLPKDLIAAFRVVRDAVDIFPPLLYQRVLTDFIRDGGFARHIRKMRPLYAVRRERMIEAIERYFRGVVEISSAAAGLHLVIRLPRSIDDKAAAARAAAAGFSCAALSACCLDSPHLRGLILGYGGVAAGGVDEAVRKLARVVLREKSTATAGAMPEPQGHPRARAIR